MKLHSDLDVNFTYQNFGSAWLGILRGSTENIELAFNSLFNLCATNGSKEYQDHLELIATFWTDKHAMRRYFFNRYYMPRYNGAKDGKLARAAMRHAWAKLEQLSATSHESYLSFDRNVAEAFGMGSITAERPDTDFKDAVLDNAFKTKDDSVKQSIDIE